MFFPNPVASLQNQSLTHQKDADSAVPQDAYHIVNLTNLDGSGYLRGDWANIRSETGDPAFSTTNTCIYTRDDDRFEQVMAYYWAVTVTSVIAPTPDPACVADWDSVSYTSTVPHCLRRVDTDLHFCFARHAHRTHVRCCQIWQVFRYFSRFGLGIGHPSQQLTNIKTLSKNKVRLHNTGGLMY